MQRKKLEELKLKDLSVLEKEAEEMKLEIAKSDAEMRAGKEKNLKKVKFLRRDLAQTLTIKKQKEIAEKEKGKEDK